MRTTVDIEERLLIQARQRALGEHVSLSDIVRLALRAYLTKQADKAPSRSFRLITAGTPGGRMPSQEEIRRAQDDELLALRIRRRRRRT